MFLHDQLAPCHPPASSSAVEQKMTSRRRPGIGSVPGRAGGAGGAGEAAHHCTSIATMPFMSIARDPRRNRQPGRHRRSRGSSRRVRPARHRGAREGATGRRPFRRREGAPRPNPAGKGSTTVDGIPSSAGSLPGSERQRISSPGGVTLRMRIRARSNSTSSESSRSDIVGFARRAVTAICTLAIGLERRDSRSAEL